jgi:type II secretory pathway component GspD/PulD (secretin)
LVSNSDAKLQPIQTGVTLMVTPHWIEPADSSQGGQVQLSIYAETSIPLQDNAIDGIPQINS